MSRRWLTTVLAAIAAATLTATTYAAPGAKPHAPKVATLKPVKVKSTTKPIQVKSTTKPVKVKSTGKPATAGPKVTKTTSTTRTTTPAVWVPSNPVAQKLSTKSNLLNRVTNSLPAGTDLNAATAGFKNFGQFVAAVNVSNNLGIKFADLKAEMTGITMSGTPTGESPVSLGRAIQELKPGLDADAEATKAQRSADREIR